MNKKIFMKGKPFDSNDSLEMQQWIEDNIIDITKSLFTSGVSTGLDVTLNSNMTLNINTGIGYDPNYKLINCTSTRQVTLGNGDSSPRYDLITLKYKTSTNNNIDTTNEYGQGTSYVISQNQVDDFDVIIHKGTPATSPSKPSIPSNELALAYVYVSANATSLTSDNIEDIRTYTDLNKDFTVDDTEIPNTNTGTTALLLSFIANRIKKITGEIDWKSDPSVNLKGVEPKIASKGTAFNKNFGTTSGTVAEGNHNHDGVYEPKITSKGTAFNKNFGTSSGTVTEGNDSRLSDSRTPKAHAGTHKIGGSDPIVPSDIGAIPTSEKGKANGVAKLDADGNVLDGSGSPVKGSVTSVNDKTGAVKLNYSDVGAQKNITKAPTEPSNPVVDDLWIDTSGEPNGQPDVLKRYTSNGWVTVGSVIDESKFVNTDGDTMTGDLTVKSNFSTSPSLTDPTAPTITQVGATASTTYKYYIIAEDAKGRRTAPSPVGQITTGYSSLSSTNYNTITWATVQGAVKYYILKNNTTTQLGTSTNTTFNDTGQTTTTYSGPLRNNSGDAIINGGLNMNTPNGYFVLPVGTDRYMT